jgi:hypothetical protein
LARRRLVPALLESSYLPASPLLRKEISSGEKAGLVLAQQESTYLSASPLLRKEVNTGKKAVRF